MAMESTSGTMAQCTKATGAKIKSTAEESTFGQMAENMTENGETIICMVKEFIPGKMEECTKVTTKMIENTGMESTPGTTVNSTKDGGRTGSNMERVSTEKMDVIEEVSGKMENVLNGLMMERVEWEILMTKREPYSDIRLIQKNNVLKFKFSYKNPQQ